MQLDTIQVFGQSYKIGRMNAITQFHVMRRLHALAASAGETLAAVQKMGGAAELERAIREKRPGENIMEVIEPVMRALGHMTDEEVNYVLHNCLVVVERQVTGGNGWAPVMPQPGSLMFSDIGMPHMIVLVWHVLRVNLANFFSDLLSALSAQGTTRSESGS